MRGPLPVGFAHAWRMRGALVPRPRAGDGRGDAARPGRRTRRRAALDAFGRPSDRAQARRRPSPPGARARRMAARPHREVRRGRGVRRALGGQPVPSPDGRTPLRARAGRPRGPGDLPSPRGPSPARGLRGVRPNGCGCPARHRRRRVPGVPATRLRAPPRPGLPGGRRGQAGVARRHGGLDLRRPSPASVDGHARHPQVCGDGAAVRLQALSPGPRPRRRGPVPDLYRSFVDGDVVPPPCVAVDVRRAERVVPATRDMLAPSPPGSTARTGGRGVALATPAARAFPRCGRGAVRVPTSWIRSRLRSARSSVAVARGRTASTATTRARSPWPSSRSRRCVASPWRKRTSTRGTWRPSPPDDQRRAAGFVADPTSDVDTGRPGRGAPGSPGDDGRERPCGEVRRGVEVTATRVPATRHPPSRLRGEAEVPQVGLVRVVMVGGDAPLLDGVVHVEQCGRDARDELEDRGCVLLHRSSRATPAVITSRAHATSLVTPGPRGVPRSRRISS